jgi:hypothetical protein
MFMVLFLKVGRAFQEMGHRTFSNKSRGSPDNKGKNMWGQMPSNYTKKSG